jgi:hypothetical protein
MSHATTPPPTTIPTATTALSSLATSKLPKPKSKSRKQLNELQIELLQILYKFRFANSKLIAQYQEQTSRNINVRLTNLLDQEYIGRNYDSSYRINRRPATYYLLPKAIRFLKTNPDLDAKGLHLLYYNRKAKPVFINHCLRLFRIYLKLDAQFGESLEFFTSTELADQTQFPRPLPDGLLNFSDQSGGLPAYVVDLLESTTPLPRLRRRVARFINHSEIGNWLGDYPGILLVCDNVGLERELQRYIAHMLNMSGAYKLRYRTTTLKALLSSRNFDDPIWSNVEDPEELTHLTELI